MGQRLLQPDHDWAFKSASCACGVSRTFVMMPLEPLLATEALYVRYTGWTAVILQC